MFAYTPAVPTAGVPLMRPVTLSNTAQDGMFAMPKRSAWPSGPTRTA